ncbi:MAG: ABC transporter substrate-binding protein, partial [Gammaproteobacteria bacterium]|nr:ABC transporter substrate-binding protein [Gammaproteobacteria bacterium]
EDVVFSFEKFMTQGVPQFASFYEDVDSYTALDEHTVQFKLKQSNRDVLFALATLTILPKHYWAERDLSEPLLEPPLSSGPYKVSDFEMGSWVKYERVDDYWAADLPVNKGRHNFGSLRYDYYKDTNVALEAFKAGEFDLRQENVSKNWAELYNGPNMEAGYIVKEEIPHEIPQGMQGFVFNTEREFFSDVRVREALTLAMDFEWMNKSLFYDQYSRSLSYFQNSDYQASGLPSDAEVAALEPYRDEIPARVFTEAYSLPVTDGSGRNRRELRRAGQLLDAAGWGLVDGKRVNAEGTELTFELLAYSPTTERITTPLIKNLEKLGVSMSIRMVDTAQYTKRMRDRDFDMISSSWQTMLYPNSNLLFYWNSNYIDSTYNKPGVRSAAVDALTQAIADNQENPDQLAVLGPALDRVLLWNFYAIPQWHISMFRVAYWDKFARPSLRPAYDLGVDTWWIDAEKAAKLPEGRQ